MDAKDFLFYILTDIKMISSFSIMINKYKPLYHQKRIYIY